PRPTLSAFKLLRRRGRGAAEDRRTLPEDDRALEIAKSCQSQELQRQTDQRGEAGMDWRDLPDAAARADRTDADENRTAQGQVKATRSRGRAGALLRIAFGLTFFLIFVNYSSRFEINTSIEQEIIDYMQYFVVMIDYGRRGREA